MFNAVGHFWETRVQQCVTSAVLFGGPKVTLIHGKALGSLLHALGICSLGCALLLGLMGTASPATAGAPSEPEKTDLSLPEPLTAQSKTHFEALSQRAVDAKLAMQPDWLALGHYKKTAFGFRSTAKGEFFFRAANGRRDPQAELLATLEDLFYPPTALKDVNLHPQCHFPARMRLIRDALQIPDGVLPEVACDYFEAWKSELSPSGISIIFASYYMGHPASIFGHTILRIHRDGKTSDLLDHGGEFAVVIPEQMNLVQMVDMIVTGLSGRYWGHYSVQRFYHFAKKYNRGEARDLWGYRIDLDDGELALLIDHLWELGAGVQFRYSFLRKNCSYELLGLFDVVRPNLKSQKDYPIWRRWGSVLPLETVRSMAKREAIESIHFDPSVATVLDLQLAQMTEEQAALANAMAIDPSESKNPTFEALDVAQQATVVDAAIELLKLRSIGRGAEREAIQKTFSGLLQTRVALEHTTEPLRPVAEDFEDPLDSHLPGRLDAHYAQTPDGPMLGLRVRPGVHGLLDPPKGFPKNANLELLTYEAGVLLETRQLVFQRFTFVDLLHLPPTGPGYKSSAFALRADIHRDTQRFGGDIGHVFDVGFAKGLRVNAEPLRLTAYLLPGATISLSNDYDRFGQLGPGVEAGAVFWALPRTRMQVHGQTQYFWPLAQPVYEVKGAVRTEISKRLTIEAQTRWEGVDQPLQWQLGLSLFH